MFVTYFSPTVVALALELATICLGTREDLEDLVATRVQGFRACGATNIEAALLHSAQAVRDHLPVGDVTVWFLTDGDETFHIQTAEGHPVMTRTAPVRI